MRALLTYPGLVLLMLVVVSCEPYEPVVLKGEYPTEHESEKEYQPVSQGPLISAYADGAEFMLYFSSNAEDFIPLYRGAERYTGNIEIPEVAPLDLWLVTIPVTQDSVWLEVGCIRVSTVNRIRMVMKTSFSM